MGAKAVLNSAGPKINCPCQSPRVWSTALTGKQLTTLLSVEHADTTRVHTWRIRHNQLTTFAHKNVLSDDDTCLSSSQATVIIIVKYLHAELIFILLLVKFSPLCDFIYLDIGLLRPKYSLVTVIKVPY